jgi:hypothetical protein
VIWLTNLPVWRRFRNLAGSLPQRLSKKRAVGCLKRTTGKSDHVEKLGLTSSRLHNCFNCYSITDTRSHPCICRVERCQSRCMALSSRRRRRRIRATCRILFCIFKGTALGMDYCIRCRAHRTAERYFRCWVRSFPSAGDSIGQPGIGRLYSRTTARLLCSCLLLLFDRGRFVFPADEEMRRKSDLIRQKLEDECITAHASLWNPFAH